MKVLDSERMLWFLFEHEKKLLLDVVCGHSFITCSFMIELNREEEAQYRAYGHDYLKDLAIEIHNSAPIPEKSKSKYKGRDISALYTDQSAKAVKEWRLKR